MKNNEQTSLMNGFADINGLELYYEIYGHGQPLVLIHGGGSTIQSNFGRLIPLISDRFKIIALELQAHGRTSDRDTDSSFEQDADDVIALMDNLGIEKANFFGFSNGATTTLQIAIRHHQRVNKMILGSVLCKRHGVSDGFWEFMNNASLDNMPKQLQEAYLDVAKDPAGLQIMHDRDAKRMQNFKDIPDELIRSVKVPTLIINGDRDVISIDHAFEIHKLIEGSELAVIPGVHGEYIGEVTTVTPDFKDDYIVVPIIERFLLKHTN